MATTFDWYRATCATPTTACTTPRPPAPRERTGRGAVWSNTAPRARKREWDAMVRQWRRALHGWDNMLPTEDVIYVAPRPVTPGVTRLSPSWCCIVWYHSVVLVHKPYAC